MEALVLVHARSCVGDLRVAFADEAGVDVPGSVSSSEAAVNEGDICAGAVTTC